MKKLCLIMVLCFVGTICMTACQPTPETPPVVSKNNGVFENAILNGAPDGYVYEPLKSYSKSESYFDGRMNITIDDNTEIIAKEGIKYPVYEVTTADFDPATVHKIAEVFFSGAQMEAHISQEQRETKFYIMNNYILPCQERIANIENGTLDPTVDEDGNQIIQANGLPLTAEEELEVLNDLLKLYRTQYESAPESVKTDPISLDNYKAGDTVNADIPLSDGKIGRLCIRDNVLTATYNHVEHVSSDVDEYYGGVDGKVQYLVNSDLELPSDYTINGKEYRYHLDSTLNYDRAVSQAEDFVNKLGLDMYSRAAVAVGGYGKDDVESETAVDITYRKFAVIFMRDVDDSVCIADDQICHYDKASGQSRGEDGEIRQYSEPFHYEKLVIWIGAEGVESIYWSSPLQIERELQSSVKLIDFERVAQTAVDGIRRFNIDGDELLDHIIKFDYNVTGMELGYSVTREKNKDGFFILVPTWFVSFDSYEEYVDEDGTNTQENIYNNRTIVVNAIDGSIIDRSLGY